MNNNDKLLHIVGYMTQFLLKHVLSQKVSEKSSQAFKKLEMNIKSRISESQLNLKVLHDPIIDNHNFLPGSESELPVLRFSKLVKKGSYCHKSNFSN